MSKNKDFEVFNTSIDSFANKKFETGLMQTDEAVAQDALNNTGFGKFNYKILALCFFICMNAAFGTLSIGFVLPAASCDFQMTMTEKGHLTISSMLGMFSSSYFWGCFADIKGRRTALLFSLFIHAGSELLASLIPFYWCFTILKFITGAAICGQVTLLYTYLAEFQPKMKRDFFLSWMEPGWIIGMILVVCIAWITVPLNINFKVNEFFFHSWNLFVMICSFPALVLGFCLTSFPETPKYLADTGQNAKMLEILARMYAENTGNPSEEYFSNLKASGNQSLYELVSQTMKTNKQENIKAQSWKDNVSNICTQTLVLVKRPYLQRTIILCSASYLIVSSYYMLILWLPDLFQKYAEFQNHFPNKSASVCTVMQSQRNKTIVNGDPYDCNSTIQDSVYLHAFFLALSCVPTALSLPLLINRTGYTYFLVFCSLIASLSTLCLFLVKTSLDNLIVSCLFESFSSVCVGVVCCMTVNLYPTHLRSIASGLAAFCGRLGSVIGNLITSLLINTNCTALILLVAMQLFLCSTLSLLTPKRNDMDEVKKITPRPSQKSGK